MINNTLENELEIKGLSGESLDILEEKINKIKEIFPEAICEGKIDFERLSEELGEFKEDKEERYRFEWAGKSEAIKIAQTPSMGTLRPCKEESKNWDTTENLYIEGDNLEVLKLLQKSYQNKVDIIYIDPPYNTGKDFIYKDNYKDNINNYLKFSNQIDESGNKVSTNIMSDGRYHSIWLSLIYPRLKLARNLLSDNGIICISIDDNEVSNLISMANEIFGEENFVANVIWERAFAPINLKKHFSENHDFIVCFAKNKDKLICNGLKRGDEGVARYKNPDNDIRGVWQSDNFSVGPVINEKVYEIITPSGKSIYPPSGRCWLLTKERYLEFLNDNRIWFGENGDNTPRLKRFLSEVKNSVTPMTIWKYSEVGHSQEAKQELKKIFNDKSFFDYPKSVKLIERILELYGSENSIVLDFFSGSATTAQGLINHNIENNKRKKFIMVQLPEPINENSEAYKDGYQNICEIGKERIRRAGDKIVSENKDKEGIEDLDIGFKVFKLDSSNIKKWNPSYDNIEQSLDDMEESFVKDRTEEDILYELMLKAGIDITYLVEEVIVSGKKIFNIGFGELLVCLDNDITTDVANEMVTLKNDRTKVIFKEAGFKDDSAKTNVLEILKRNKIKEVISV